MDKQVLEIAKLLEQNLQLQSSIVLPEDVVIEILVYLPVKALLRFRCVSKSWRNLIKSPSFINNHLFKVQKSINYSDLMMLRNEIPSGDELSFHNLDNNNSSDYIISSSFLEDLLRKNKQNIQHHKGRVRVLGPCNGLLCIFIDRRVFLCNPALWEFKLIPRCPSFKYPPGYHIRKLGEGFGINTTNNDFHIIQLRLIIGKVSREQYPIHAHLYSLSTNAWKQIEINDTTVMPYFCDPYPQIFLNNSCHWNAAKYYSDHRFHKEFIFSFDMNAQVFRKFDYPDCLTSDEPKDHDSQVVVVINDCLGMVQFQGSIKEAQMIELWVMKEYGVKESWTKQFVIGPLVITRPLFVWKNHENQNCLLVEISNCQQLVSCAIASNEITKFQAHRKGDTLQALIYKESLISLKN